LQLLESELAARADRRVRPEQITENMVMAKRDIVGELVEGVAAMKSHREGKLMLRSYKVDAARLPKMDSKLHPRHSKEAALFKSGVRTQTAH
jgi:hypothetical protein